MRVRRPPCSRPATRVHEEAAIRACSPALITDQAAAVVLLLNGRSGSQTDVMATATCPEPLRRILVATQTSAPGTNDVVGAATPSPTIDPTEQHPTTATATFRPDDGGRAEPVTVTIDDGSGAQDYGLITGWYALMENPVAGRYRTQQTIWWEQVPRPAATDTAADDAERVGARRHLTGTVDVEIIVG